MQPSLKGWLSPEVTEVRWRHALLCADSQTGLIFEWVASDLCIEYMSSVNFKRCTVLFMVQLPIEGYMFEE